MAEKHSNKIVADWMLEKVKVEPLHQQVAAKQILQKFGEFYVNQNPDAPLTIQQGVLKAFETISRDTVVWEEQSRFWRLRENDDHPGRTQ